MGEMSFVHTLEWKGEPWAAPVPVDPDTVLAALGIPDVPTLTEIRAVEARLFATPGTVTPGDADTLGMDTFHHFAEGIYGRELRIPAGMILTGKLHRKGCLNILVRGHITVWTQHGRQDLHGPAVFPSLPGIKRLGVAHTETLWITAHATDLTDINEIERDLVIPEPRTIEVTPA